MTEPERQKPLYRAVIEYDGSDFLGFQIQAEGRTVQGELEQALHRLCQQEVRVAGSGRTDAGVHASGQVIAFRVDWMHPIGDLHRGLNALLPTDLSVSTLDLAPANFHPRFSAVARWYRYQIGQWPGHSPLRSRYAWELDPDLNVAAMAAAGERLIGTHNFAAFGQPPQGENTVRQVINVRWHSQPPYLLFDIIANAFLRRMVRTLVATLVWVGQGRITVADFEALLKSRDRSLAAPPAPPQGLCLMAVTYPPDHIIIERQINQDSPAAVPLSD
ncbi:MAG: tRNA pseudouridine(38-40) synthase TruA [Caldilineales bacterium]|nr:tRNA pseudouridine(38-40) synthase TruA [Caldilineales bacterium]